jgi:hypothetical protein
LSPSIGRKIARYPFSQLPKLTFKFFILERF